MLLLCRRRCDAVQAQVHGGCCVVVSPAAASDQCCHGARSLVPTKKLDAVSELGVVHLPKCFAAKGVRRFHSGDELVLRVALFGFLNFRRRHIRCLRANRVIEFNDVRDQMGKGHLLRRGLIGKLVSGHGLDGTDSVVLRTLQQRAERCSDRILGGSLSESEAGTGKECYDNESTFHGKPPEEFKHISGAVIWSCGWDKLRFTMQGTEKVYCVRMDSPFGKPAWEGSGFLLPRPIPLVAQWHHAFRANATIPLWNCMERRRDRRSHRVGTAGRIPRNRYCQSTETLFRSGGRRSSRCCLSDGDRHPR